MIISLVDDRFIYRINNKYKLSVILVSIKFKLLQMYGPGLANIKQKIVLNTVKKGKSNFKFNFINNDSI